MTKRLIGALLAAAALLPAVAAAQDGERGPRFRAPRAMQAEDAPRQPREAGPRNGGWQRPERPQATVQAQPQAQQPGGGWQARSDRGWSRPEGNGQPRGDRGPDQQRGWQQRAERGDGQPRVWQQRPDQGEGQPRVWQQRSDRGLASGGWAQRTDRNPNQANDRRDRNRNDADAIRQRRDWIARSGRGRDWSDRNDQYRDRSGFYDRRDWAQGRGWYGDRDRDGWNDRGGSGRGWNNGGGWNRGWRNDRRYDWNAYRVSNRSLYRLPRYYAPYGWNYGYRRFGVGITLDSMLFAQSYWIDDPWEYRLPPADGPYRWVRYYNDALLVDVDSGEVVDVIYGIFW